VRFLAASLVLAAGEVDCARVREDDEDMKRAPRPVTPCLLLCLLAWQTACKSAREGGASGLLDASGADTVTGSSPCPSSWATAPAVDPSIAVPADGGGLLLHASGVGTQSYACTASADGGAGWTLLGPVAQLYDCHGALIGHHFASDAGAGSPEWQTGDGAYVIGHKVAALLADGGTGSVPPLLLKAVGSGGSGALSRAAYVQRLATDGGVARGPCVAGETLQVPYGADYYFYGP
jgi:hypothetical protein